MNGKTSIETAKGGGSTEGIPQIEFFEDPVRMSVAPNGRVLHVSGAAGWADLIKDLPSITPLEFPGSDAQPGTQWDSAFTLPVPGAGQPASARMHNTLLGYQYLGSRYCAVIQQDIDANQRDGSLTMPKSVLGDEAGFQMPLFDLRGRNYAYFDVQRGQLAHTTSDLELTLKIGSMLDQTAGVLQDAAKGLADVFNGQAGPMGDLFGDGGGKSEGLDLVVNIHSTMTLADLQSTVGMRPR